MKREGNRRCDVFWFLFRSIIWHNERYFFENNIDLCVFKLVQTLTRFFLEFVVARICLTFFLSCIKTHHESPLFNYHKTFLSSLHKGGFIKNVKELLNLSFDLPCTPNTPAKWGNRTSLTLNWIMLSLNIFQF